MFKMIGLLLLIIIYFVYKYKPEDFSHHVACKVGCEFYQGVLRGV